MEQAKLAEEQERVELAKMEREIIELKQKRSVVHDHDNLLPASQKIKNVNKQQVVQRGMVVHGTKRRVGSKGKPPPGEPSGGGGPSKQNDKVLQWLRSSTSGDNSSVYVDETGENSDSRNHTYLAFRVTGKK